MAASRLRIHQSHLWHHGHKVTRAIRVTRMLVLVLAAAMSLARPAGAGTQTTSGPVYIASISGTIDLGLAPYLERVLKEARDASATAVVLDINTPGGRLDAVLQMRDALLSSDVRTIAFVDRTAFSAGALIAIAAHEIYMTPAAVIGAATPVEGSTGEIASEKVISAVRKTFKTTAEARGRDPRVAEAMVDPDVEIPHVVERGKLLTLTTVEALAVGYADGVVSTRSELLSATGLAGAAIVEVSPGLAEKLVRFLTDPVVASLVIILAMLLLIGDFLTEGLGLPAAAGAALLALFFWGHLLAGLTGWEDIALVLLGLVLIAVEVLILPGFGIAGILGLLALFSGFVLAMLSRTIRTPEQTEQALKAAGFAFLGVVVGIALLLVFLPHSRLFGKLVLDAHVGGESSTRQHRAPRRGRWFRPRTMPATGPTAPAPPAAPPPQSLTGVEGIAVSDLRPSGVAEVNGRRIDVITEGVFLPAGTPIVVIRDEGYRRVVRRREG